MPNRLDSLFNRESGDLPKTVHASCVAHKGAAVLILGQSGAGKSSLAMQLLALGAELLADDRTILTGVNGKVMASVPDAIAGLIEARGVGILHAEFAGPTPVALIIDLDHEETERLPKPRSIDLMGQATPVLYAVQAAHFPAAILQYLSQGKLDE
ncbi:Hpr(Ser) kinase/phosphatase [Shimia gijangensis]|uniref:Hpr(Ser) kinase/phosphatase n=1 Tax=Shimia gijangensis TaxID=1470563 RepID=A0A1M6MDV9_9RHOB|nr:hypothetical protein [Shimia gijangensis]SHJ81590.1 Hpr(Ser) kinase/phosphatase [Shimia gijangensis]